MGSVCVTYVYLAEHVVWVPTGSLFLFHRGTVVFGVQVHNTMFLLKGLKNGETVEVHHPATRHDHGYDVDITPKHRLPRTGRRRRDPSERRSGAKSRRPEGARE